MSRPRLHGEAATRGSAVRHCNSRKSHDRRLDSPGAGQYVVGNAHASGRGAVTNVQRRRRARFDRASVVALLIQLCGAADVRAQTAVPSTGEWLVSFTYQTYDVPGHFDRQGRENNNGGTYTQALITEIDFPLHDSIGLRVSLPFIASKYTGPPCYMVGPFPTCAGPQDDGTYHGAFQDLRIEGRWVFEAGPFAVAPFLAGSFPTHDYETVGEAVPGRHRRDLQVGASADVALDLLVPRTYTYVRYGYGAAEREEGFPFTRSNIDVEGGYALTSRLLLRGVAGWQIAHEGPTLEELAPDWEHHDRFIAPSYLNLGAGAAFALTPSLDIYGLWVQTVSGRNGAHRARMLGIGLTVWVGGGLSLGPRPVLRPGPMHGAAPR
jgi:hypothetical protein